MIRNRSASGRTSTWHLSLADLWKLATILLTLATLYYGISTRLVVLELRVHDLASQIDRQRENVSGLEQYLMDWARGR